jgi:hypothetical protein
MKIYRFTRDISVSNKSVSPHSNQLTAKVGNSLQSKKKKEPVQTFYQACREQSEELSVTTSCRWSTQYEIPNNLYDE